MKALKRSTGTETTFCFDVTYASVKIVRKNSIETSATCRKHLLSFAILRENFISVKELV